MVCQWNDINVGPKSKLKVPLKARCLKAQFLIVNRYLSGHLPRFSCKAPLRFWKWFLDFPLNQAWCESYQLQLLRKQRPKEKKNSQSWRKIIETKQSFAHLELTEQLYPSNRTSTRSLVVETKTSSLLDVGPKTTSKVKVWSLRTALFKSRCRFCFLPILI